MVAMSHGRGLAHVKSWRTVQVRGPTARRAAAALVAVTILVGGSVVGLRLLDSTRSSPLQDRAVPPVVGLTPDPGADAADVPGLTAPGVHVHAVPRIDGDLDVVERVRFLGSSTGLELAPPSMVGVMPSALPLGVRIDDLHVYADGRPVDAPRDSLTTGGRLLLPTAPLAVELRYRLVGTAIKSTPSTPGRALVILPPIAADDSLSRLPVVVEISGKNVRNLVCPGLAPPDQLCGRQTSTGWRTVSLPPRVTAVLAQLDLPVH
jgi:hypothetical protein